MQAVLRPALKICGVRSPASAALIDGVADYVGTVVAPLALSPRAATPGEARKVARALSSSRHVVVAAGASPWQGLAAALEAGSQVLQPHMALRPETLRLLALEAEKHGIRIAPVLLHNPLTGEWSPEAPEAVAMHLAELRGVIEYVLLDVPKAARARGARLPPSAVAEAAEKLRGLRLAAAGGVTAETACSYAAAGAGVVDVSSWADRPGSPGVKDPGRVAELASALQSCSPGRVAGR